MKVKKWFPLFVFIFSYQTFANPFYFERNLRKKNILIKEFLFENSNIVNDLLRPFENLFKKSNKTIITPSDDAFDLVDTEGIPLITSPIEIYEKGLNSFQLEGIFWTGYYWSMRNGLLGGRLADGKFLRLDDWQSRRDFINSNPASNYIPKKINILSPSEKFDLLMGDKEESLTKFMWNLGQEYLSRNGEILSWIGFCDGLAMATTNFPPPKRAVTLWSVDGKHKIKFYPEDIKALGTLLWKRGKFSYYLIGDRCDASLPEVDENGRFTSPGCLNTNPGTFHLALANQIGRAKRSFVMDSVSSSEVWNFPVVGYSFTYINLETGEEYENPKNAIIPISDFFSDRFSAYRAPSAKFIVGVTATINFIKNQPATFKDLEEPDTNYYSTETLSYDLELDQNGKIIGGEWSDNNHPDFLWINVKNSWAQGPFDNLITGNWDPKKELIPQNWIEPILNSTKAGIVPSPIVKALFELSNAQEDGYTPN